MVNPEDVVACVVETAPPSPQSPLKEKAEFTAEQYQLARVAYDAYAAKAVGASLVEGSTRLLDTIVQLPPFDKLSQAIKDAWAAAANAVMLEMFRVEFAAELGPIQESPVEGLTAPDSSDIRNWRTVI